MPDFYSRQKLNLNSLKHLSLRLAFPTRKLQEVAAQAEILYTFDREHKKNGGFRDISKPHYRLKIIQSAIHRLLFEVRVSDSAHGGIKKRSNLTNAQVHCNQRLLLNLDFKEFFPSISHYRIYSLFHVELGCSPQVASILTRLTTVKGQVPQGGPMSTDLANLVMRNTDERLEGLARKFDLNYTRFVDDITFSGEKISKEFVQIAKEIILQSGFYLNPEKEDLIDNSKLKIVTGLAVHRKRPNFPRNKRRTI